MNYQELEQLVMVRVHNSEAKHKEKYGDGFDLFDHDWTPLHHVRWFVANQMVSCIWELTNKDKAEECFYNTWPVCTTKEHVKEWLSDRIMNGLPDYEIIELLNEHFSD